MPWNTIGHEWAVDLLARAAAAQPSHAYLFAGPPQIGKTTLALDFARALNCTGEGERPCGRCRACTAIEAGRHPDVQLVRRLPEKTDIVIEQLRDLQHDLVLRPYEARWRVAIVENMHEANLYAANAFLKTLEEPPPQVVVVLTATNPEALPLTIRSRCQVILLRPLPTGRVEQALRERYGVDAERARLLARLSGGRIGWAIEASRSASLLAQRGDHLRELLEALSGGRSARIELAGRLTQGEEDPKPVLDLWLGWWRDLLLIKGQRADAVVNLDFQDRLAHDAGRLELGAIGQYIEAIQAARQQVEQNVNPRLALEVMLLSAPL